MFIACFTCCKTYTTTAWKRFSNDFWVAAGAEETALSAEYSELLADDSDEVEEDLDEIIRAADSDVSARRSVQQLR